jgi:Tfp pilus assembly protein PilE
MGNYEGQLVAVKIRRFTHPIRPTRSSGFTLAEVVISVGIAAIGIGGIVWGYVATSHRAEWTTCSAAAHQMAMRCLEQTRAAKWDPLESPPLDELPAGTIITNTMPLDLPMVGNTPLMATTVTTIEMVSANPLLKMVRVDCSWSLMSRGPFTNTVITYRAPDQ